MKNIIYPNGVGISIIIPSPEWLKTIKELAKKDVPQGIPYLIINASDVPADRTSRNLWTADFSTPDGYGGTE